MKIYKAAIIGLGPSGLAVNKILYGDSSNEVIAFENEDINKRNNYFGFWLTDWMKPFENIIETFEWMKSNEFTSIIIVTSDYHLPRVKLEINRFIDNQQIFYEAVKTDESDSILRLKKITLEYIKYIRTFLSIKIGINE